MAIPQAGHTLTAIVVNPAFFFQMTHLQLSGFACQSILSLELFGRSSSKDGALVGFLRLGSYWGLAGWYPKGVISNATASSPKKGKKRVRKSKATENAKTSKTSVMSTTTPPSDQKKQPGAFSDRAVELLKTKPEREYSLKEIADHLGKGVIGTRLNLERLVRAGRVRMSAPGMYAIGKPQLMAAGD